MPYSVALYSPDTHVAYNGRTPDEQGIGGGVTARVRLTRALARQGHQVTAYVNCDRPGMFDGVEYLPVQSVRHINADILIAVTTGGDLSLLPLARLDLRARLKCVWVNGVPRLDGLPEIAPDVIFAASNFLRATVLNSWSVPTQRVLTCYMGLDQAAFRAAERSQIARDEHAVLYLGHPDKGLDRALAIIRQLRQHDDRFHLDIYGGNAIWGQAERSFPNEPGINFKGLIGQAELVSRLFSAGFCLAFQDIPEGFGIAVQEAKRAGVIVLASNVGAFEELIHSGYDGFLEQDAAAAHRIMTVLQDPNYMDFVRKNALATPWDWDLAAQTWTALWAHCLNDTAPPSAEAAGSPVSLACPSCRIALLALADGWHCLDCGRFYPRLDQVACLANRDGPYSEMPQPEMQQLLGNAARGAWRQAVSRQFADRVPLLNRLIQDETRGLFHFLLELKPDSLVLDIGAGFGAIAAAISRQCQVVALDDSFLRLAFLRLRVLEDHLNRVTLVHGNGLALPFIPGQFDLITLVGVLEWAGLADPATAPEELQQLLLREAYLALKPGGCLYIGIENQLGYKYLLGDPDDHTGLTDITHLPRAEASIRARAINGEDYRVRTHTRPVYRSMLQACGFKGVEFCAPYADYRLWTALIPLQPAAIASFYLDYLQEDLPPGHRPRQVQTLERAAARLENLADFVNSYAILAWK